MKNFESAYFINTLHIDLGQLVDREAVQTVVKMVFQNIERILSISNSLYLQPVHYRQRGDLIRSEVCFVTFVKNEFLTMVEGSFDNELGMLFQSAQSSHRSVVFTTFEQLWLYLLHNHVLPKRYTPIL